MPPCSQHTVLAPVRANGLMHALRASNAVAWNWFCAATLGWRSWEGQFTMSMFDQDTSTMRMRMENTPIELRKPELGPQSKARGIMVGVLLGVGAWAAIIALAVAMWRWLR